MTFFVYFFVGYFEHQPFLDSEAPIVLCDCIAFLRHHGLQNVGLFRTSGNKDRIDELVALYDKEYFTKEMKEANDASIFNDCLVNFNVREVASLMKQYFTTLNEPIISAEVRAILFICKLDSKFFSKEFYTSKLSEIIQDLKSPNKEVFGMIISFIREVCCFHKYNSMDPKNLSICWAISLFTSVNDRLNVLESQFAISVLTDIINLPIELTMPSLEVVRKNTKYRKRNV